MSKRNIGSKIRDCKATDLPEVHAIYAGEVLRGLASFEEVIPSLEEMTDRWRQCVSSGFPYLVAIMDEEVIGFGFVSNYRPRSAYRYCVENTIYVHELHRGKGVGKALLSAVIECCEKREWQQMIAIIGDTGNTGSRALHQSLGFREVGVLKAVGYKLGRWVDSVIMQRSIEGSAPTIRKQ